MTAPKQIIPYGFCHCGCGQQTPIATKTRSVSGHIKGQPLRYIRYHYRFSEEDIEKLRNALTRHGHNTHYISSPTRNSWRAMMERCYNKNNQAYQRYGGVGIVVCEKWHNFEGFLLDMGIRPEGKTLDRFPNPYGNYEPSNCRWATPIEQGRNRRKIKAWKSQTS